MSYEEVLRTVNDRIELLREEAALGAVVRAHAPRETMWKWHKVLVPLFVPTLETRST